MIGVLIIAHGTLGEALVQAVTHVLGSKPPQFGVFAVSASDDPLLLLPKARAALATYDTGDGALVFSDLYGATPCNLAIKLAQPGRIEVVSGVNLPMLVRAFTYRTKGMETLVRKAISGGCEGVLHVEIDPVYAATRS
jgi:PTS system ascorbate-specific IIA component